MMRLKTQLDSIEYLNRYRWLIAWTVAVAMFMENLDTTIISIAIPHIAESFHIKPVPLKLALTSYLMSLAIFIPISGWMADRFGAKRIFNIAMIVFLLGSILCGLSMTLQQLVAARVLQGIGGAMMMPVGRLILLRLFSKPEFTRAMNIVIIAGFIGPALGPLIGGIIVAHVSWRWIFFVNVPVGVIGLWIALRYLPQVPPQTVKKFDAIGFVLFGVGLAMLELALTVLADGFDAMVWTVLSACAAVLFLGIYFWRSKRVKAPVLDLSLLKIPSMSISLCCTIMARIAIGSIFFLFSLLLQLVWNVSPEQAGLMFVPLALGIISSKAAISTRTLQTFGYRQVLLVNTGLLSINVVGLGFAVASDSIVLICILLFIQGLITSQQFTALGSLSVSQLAPPQYSHATSITSTVQQFSGALGVAIAAVLLVGLSHATHAPVMSVEVFRLVLIILGLCVSFSLFVIVKIDKDLKLQRQTTLG